MPEDEDLTEKFTAVEEGEAPPEGDIAPDEEFNPKPLKELVQAPNREDLFGK